MSNMKYQTLITPSQVLSLAFSDAGYISPETISPSDVCASVERWILPVVGGSLLDKVEQGGYPTLMEEYLLPAAAACVRMDIQPRLNVATSQLGLSVVAGSNNKAADVDMRAEQMLSLRQRARALLRRLTDHLEEHSEEYPEYSSAANVMLRVSNDGGFVQIL
jgi:hypothetical protein